MAGRRRVRAWPEWTASIRAGAATRGNTRISASSTERHAVRGRGRWGAGSAALLLILTIGPQAVATADNEGPPSVAAAGAAAVARPALQPLPRWSEPELPPPEAADLARLDGLVDLLLSDDVSQRDAALASLRNVDATWLPALAERFD